MTDTDRITQQYADYRAQLVNGALEMVKTFDQWVLTLSGGAIGVSLALLDKLQAGLCSISVLLSVAWSVLVASLVTGLWSIHASYRLHQRLAVVLNEEAEKSATGLWGRYAKRTEGIGRGIDILNYCSLGLCVSGIGLLVVVAMIAVAEA